MGKLEVDVFGVSWETIWTATGNQGNAWHLATIPISGKTKLRYKSGRISVSGTLAYARWTPKNYTLSSFFTSG